MKWKLPLLLAGIAVPFVLTTCGVAAARLFPGQPAATMESTPCPTVNPSEAGTICEQGVPEGTIASLPTATPPLLAGPAALPQATEPTELLPTAQIATPIPAANPTGPSVQPVGVQAGGCPDGVCVLTPAISFQRPIAAPGVDRVDTAYRFGSTQGGQRDPHHGVEFLNPQGTPVLAAADGEVVVAGDDRKVFYGPYSYFYGNLVILRHADFTAVDGNRYPVFTLYAHLASIEVQVGERVKAGQELGKVGMTGVATGSHLHFEVRLGDTSYASSRNPELWLAPHASANGVPNGMLAGRIIDTDGSYVETASIVVRHLLGEGQSSDWEIYLGSYEEKALIGKPPFQESFAAGDLPPGRYEISFVKYGMQRRIVEVFPGKLSLVTIDLGASK